MSVQHTKLIHQHSFDTVTMSSSRRPSRCGETSFTCSQQSILSAMERFVKAVQTMDSTVLVPIKLRDMDLQCTKAGLSKTKLPAILQNGDLYAFYLLLHEAKKELLWGPSNIMSTMATCTAPCSLRSSNGTLNSITSTGSNGNLPSPTYNGAHAIYSNRGVPSIAASKTSGSSASLVSIDTNTSSHVTPMLPVTGPSTSTVNGATNACGNNVNASHTGSVANGIKRENTHSRQPSDDSLASFGSGTCTLDLDSESEVDSLLHERDTNQTDHTLHLAAAFKHHLQGLHTILHQLSDAADYFCARYQEEIDASGSH